MIYAVVHNVSGGGEAHYVKRFENLAVFERWKDMMSPLNGGHISVLKHWHSRPPCGELSDFRKRYKATWLNNP